MPDPRTLTAAAAGGGAASPLGVAASPLIEKQDALWARYDLTAQLAAGSSAPNGELYRSSALVVAAFAVTICRWTAVDQIAIAVTNRHSQRIDDAYVVRLHVEDHVIVNDFLRTVDAAQDAKINDGLTISRDSVDLIVASDHTDLRSGHICFITDVPDAAHGFVADVAAAVNELGSLNGLLCEVRCIAPDRRPILDALAGADVATVDIETMFLAQVHRWPQQVAVRDRDVELTYEQLALAADQHAHTLWSVGVRPGDTVLIATRRSVGEVVALLAVIRVGAAYSGFDDDAPYARAEKIIGKLAPAAVVVDATTTDLPILRNLTRVDAWRPGRRIRTDARPIIRPLELNDPRRTAYIAFTSGSTGEPKGVVVPHHAVTRLALTAELHMQPDDRVLRMAPLAFDASTYEVWVPLLTGATLEVFPEKLPSIGKLDSFLTKREISIAFLTTSVFRLIAKSRPQALAGLRWIITGGEVLPHGIVARILELHRGLVITHAYGPTENTTFTTLHTIRDSIDVDGPLPIGQPIAGTRVFVLDRNARLVPPGAIGELYAAGLGLANGYLDNEHETSSRFGYLSPDVNEPLYRTGDLVRLDPYGRLLYLCRVDKQIKLNGHRIETEEISAALARHPAVRDAVIIISRSANYDDKIVAAVAVISGANIDSRALHLFLSQLLPGYMIPALWALVDEIPLTRNGKVDEPLLIESAVPAARRFGAQ